MQNNYDVVVVGSGAGAFMAAIRAAKLGASVLMLEKQATYGGTSARSGGGLWVPNNKNIADAGVVDSPEDAFEYMRKVIPEEQVADDTIRNYIESSPQMLDFLNTETPVHYVPVPGYADYYPSYPGWKEGGRTMDPSPIDGRPLGDMLYKMEDTPKQSKAMGIFGMSILEGSQILATSPGWQKIVAGIFGRYLLDIVGRLKGLRDRRLCQGNSLIGGMLMAAQKLGVELVLETGVTRLVKEGDKVVGVVARSDALGEFEIRVNKAVVVASGGFEHNPEMRKANLPQPTESNWSAANPGNTGDLIIAGQEIGAATGLMNEAWWAPVVKNGDTSVVLFSEKSKPGLIIVDKKGRRFMNEAITYNSYGECFYNAKEAGYDCVPAYMIFDGNYRKKYFFGGIVQSSMSPDFMNRSAFGPNGMLIKADTLDELAGKLGVDRNGLQETVAKMAEYARTGVDEEFGRGSDAHDRMYGDMEVSPNPCLGPLDTAPYYGAPIYPGDIGTKGGLVIDHDGRVQDEQGNAIEGLYAAGNCTASIMGDKYPGAGCTLGPAMTIAFRAANHLMAQ
ncbi:FAD-dependent oxidoreductase [Seongchinamella sediminis]|uniref:3-oxosteroid 1-dehydrogenase n=1 Tax=Seongchinamella sediminis TaxID=2283635 RepID=A0A3L7DUK2_9GAMM|nr:FAD-dependent oxidoreductase [Seongchinamella sediminis]RLQ21064.1 FAD-dependent oxidoreductase [Seongchinamella sediminis]